MRALEVVAAGPLATVQDLGRPGQAHLGVGTSGACDRASLRRANRLAGNPEGAAGLELTLGGAVLRARRRLVVALTGARGSVIVDAVPVAMDTPLEVPDGAVLRVETPVAGLRTYVAVQGGLDVAVILGSRSSDLLAGLGLPPLVAGDVVRVGAATQGWAPVDVAPGRRLSDGEVILRVEIGPRADWFTAESLRRLGASSYEVTSQSNRTGLRLAGPTLERARATELPSEGLLPGAVQVPPSGRPTLLLADHPVTGGYPVVAVVRDADLDLAGQLRPGQRVRLHPMPASWPERGNTPSPVEG